jgi:hypothetical protein
MCSLIEESFLQFKSSVRYEEKVASFVQLFEASDVTFAHLCTFKEVLLRAMPELLGPQYGTDTHHGWSRLLTSLLVKIRAPMLKSTVGAMPSPEVSERMYASSTNIVIFN